MNAVQRYICGRLASALPVLFGVSLLAFGLGQLSPGDPAEIMLEGTGMGMPSCGCGASCTGTAACPTIWGCRSSRRSSTGCL